MATNRYIKNRVGSTNVRWQPISTSPKTGEVRLLHNGYMIYIGFWGSGGVTQRGQLGWRDGTGHWRLIIPAPKHWMPIQALWRLLPKDEDGQI